MSLREVVIFYTHQYYSKRSILLEFNGFRDLLDSMNISFGWPLFLFRRGGPT